MKKCIVFVPAMFAIVLFVAVPAQASSFDDSLVGVSQTQALPDFMQGMDAVPMTESEMGEVRGELIWIPIMAGVALVSITYVYYKWVTDPQWVMNNVTASDIYTHLLSP